MLTLSSVRGTRGQVRRLEGRRHEEDRRRHEAEDGGDEQVGGRQQAGRHRQPHRLHLRHQVTSPRQLQGVMMSLFVNFLSERAAFERPDFAV